MTNSFHPDECCSPHLNAAALSGLLDAADTWECPDCGCEWKPRVIAGLVKWWEPRPLVMLW